MRHAARARAAILGALLATMAACSSTPLSTAPILGRSELTALEPTVETTAPLTGEALDQRKLEMRRSARDLVQFGATAQTLRLRRDRSLKTFQAFMDRYVKQRVDPLLDGDQVSEDPEYALLDAELRLVKAELLIEVKDYWSAGDVIGQIEDRYKSRGTMLVNFPVGRQSTLAEAINYLRLRNKGEPGVWVPSPKRT